MLSSMRTSAIVLVVCLCACRGGGDDENPGVVRSDSAGVSIVTSSQKSWPEEGGWKILPEPILQIGTVAGDSSYQLHQAHTPIRLSDGRIAVANGGTGQLRYFDSTGKFLLNVGREGQGPGEWSQLYQLRRGGGDTLLVVQPVNTHSIISPEGRYLDRFELAPVRDRPNIWGLGKLSSGHMVAYSLSAAGERPVSSSPVGEEAMGRDTTKRPDDFYREPHQHFIYDMRGRMIDSIGFLPGDVEYGGDKMSQHTASSLYNLRHDRLYFGPGDANEVRIFRFEVEQDSTNVAQLRATNPEARKARMILERIVRRTPDRPLEVTPATLEVLKESVRDSYRKMVAESPPFPINIEMQVEHSVFPPRLPAQSRLLVDSEQNIWEQRYNMPKDTLVVFTVYSPDGVWLGPIVMPDRFRPTDIGRDYILGIWRDHEDVQFIRMYRLAKGS